MEDDVRNLHAGRPVRPHLVSTVYDFWQRSAYRETSLEPALKVSPRGACDDGLVYRFESRSTVPESASRERYFTAALEILTAQGFGHLTMTALHRRLGVSSGSFYHFFAGWDDFVAQFLESWITQTAEISLEAQQTSDPFDRLEILRLLAKSVPHAAEAAMRMWSATDSTVATAQRHVDTQRLAIIAEAVSNAGVADVRADRLARHGLSLIVGWQQLSLPFDAHGLDELLGQFIDLVHGYASPP